MANTELSTWSAGEINQDIVKEDISRKCGKVASCFHTCMGLMRTVRGVSNDGQAADEAVSTQNHCPTYRQIPGAGTGAGSAPAKRVPVLFSTNRGLYLRLAPGHPGNQMEVLTLQPRGQNYNISFCDLERWSTHRANVVSLEDTFTIMQQRNMSPESQNYQPRLWKNNVSYSLMH